jgi:tetratricopeptide (TPR) repeat protein
MRFWRIVASLFLLSAVLSAQRSGGGAAPAPTTTGPAGGRTGTVTTTPTPFPGDDTLGQRPIFISGKVVLDDGTPLPDRVKIERVCNANPRVEAYTDRKGRFSFELGRTYELQDASVGPDPADPGSPFGGSRAQTSSGRIGGVNERALWGCELRAALPGFRSDVVELSNIRYLDNTDIGTIVLHRVGNSQGMTVSATSELAPKDARKALDKGLEAARKNNPEEAEKQFRKAVEIYPRFAAAWLNLGRLLEQRNQISEARQAYGEAIRADARFMPPYERLSLLALKESKWQELADRTDQLLRLDPIEYPDAYYLNSVANYQLHNYDAAEKNAREAIRLDPNKKNMRSRYVLGLVLAQKQEFAASAESLRSFLDSSPAGSDTDLIKKQLSQIEDAAREQANHAKPQQDSSNAPPAENKAGSDH